MLPKSADGEPRTPSRALPSAIFFGFLLVSRHKVVVRLACPLSDGAGDPQRASGQEAATFLLYLLFFGRRGGGGGGGSEAGKEETKKTTLSGGVDGWDE